ncbi:c-type cytochrome [Thiolinea disciformis]|uniref:c-type cytochrome n=1 Tax=Thiolinea disciformis TaxID=125614 RepID=UPI00037CF6AE|nr:c-type cytochrome [Thiolinea disciformis]
MKKTLIMALAVMTFGSSAVWAADVEIKGDAAAGKTKSATCAACHGADGNSTNPEWPKLAGQNAQYLFKQLMDFKAQKRVNASMAPMVAPLNPQDMADLAAYFSTQKAAPGKADQTKAQLGSLVFKGGNTATGVAACASCHSPTGLGNPAANFPALSGQHVAYTKIQLQAFRQGARNNDAGKMMQNVANKMSDAEMDAVAEYISGLQQ